MTRLLLLPFLVLFLWSCDSGPKVIESADGPGSTGEGTSIVEKLSGAQPSADEHHVEVAEVLHTEKYTYLRVKEDERDYWIAIPRSEVEVGEHLVYRGGLTKKNFLSREYNRVFETLVLVSDIGRTGQPDAMADGGMPEGHPAIDAPTSVTPAPGAVRIGDLFATPAKYEGKTVKVTGKCVKVNPMIMNRNWIHLQDGTGKGVDLTVTTADNIALGSLVTMEGTIALNKDFGAGYRYDIIMEGATQVQ